MASSFQELPGMPEIPGLPGTDTTPKPKLDCTSAALEQTGAKQVAWGLVSPIRCQVSATATRRSLPFED